MVSKHAVVTDDSSSSSTLESTGSQEM